MKLFDALCGLGDDSPVRSQIALDILAKSKGVDHSKLVRVQRPVNRNGKTFMAHFWVAPDKVKKNDVVTQNGAQYQKWLKEHPEAPKATVKTNDKNGSGSGDAPAKKDPLKFLAQASDKFNKYAGKKKQQASKPAKEDPNPEAKPAKETKPKESDGEAKAAAKKDPLKFLADASAKFDKFANKKKQVGKAAPQEQKEQSDAETKKEAPKKESPAKESEQKAAKKEAEPKAGKKEAAASAPKKSTKKKADAKPAADEKQQGKDSGSKPESESKPAPKKSTKKKAAAKTDAAEKPKAATDAAPPKSESAPAPEPEASGEHPETELDGNKLAQLKDILDPDEFQEYLDDWGIAPEAAQAAMDAAGESEPSQEAPAPEPAEDTAEPQSDASPEEPDTYADKQADKQDEAKKQDDEKKPDIFSSGLCDKDLIAAIYYGGAVKLTDNLASTDSYQHAINGLKMINDANPGFESTTLPKAVAAIATQHNEALYGKKMIQDEIAAYNDTEAAKYYPPELIAAAVRAWKNGDHAAIRKQSVNHDCKADPVNNMYSKCLTDMVRHSGTVQQGTLYRGMHTSEQFLIDAIESGKVDTAGLVSTSKDAQSARKYALNTEAGQVSVILELPSSLKMKTLELDGGESLLSTHGSISVQMVTKDADGIYHVRLKAATDALSGHIADDDVYDALGLDNPNKAKAKTDDGIKPDPSDYKAVVAKAKGLNKKPSKCSRDTVIAQLEYVYKEYGYDGCVQYLTAFAKTQVGFKNWAEKFKDTKTGYDPALLSMARGYWIDGHYRKIREMQGKELDDNSTSMDVFNKMCADSLNSMVEKDGIEQPKRLYRGVKLSVTKDEFTKQYTDAQEGSSVTLGAISSFSASAHTANGFAGFDGIILELPEETKTKCTYVEGLGESEYLVQDAEYVVTKREKKDGRLHLTIELKA